MRIRTIRYRVLLVRFVVNISYFGQQQQQIEAKLSKYYATLLKIMNIR